MLNDLAVVRLAAAKARYAADRHAVFTENIANADTPGFKAKDLEPFEAALDRVEGKPSAAFDFQERTIVSPSAESPNGNTVSIENEMARLSEATRGHETALLVWSKAIDLIRTAIGRK